YRTCAELELPILFHVGDQNSDISSPTRLYNVINRLPELTVIAAHMCGYQAWDEAEQVLIGTPVYTETSDALIGLAPERVYRMIKKHGADKVMFGSDYPLRLTGSAYDELDKLPLTEEEKQKIFYSTAKKVFGLM
ncbi:MAG TPA: amidohydrolase, partial [Clostridiales bacterium]|nr:amidohydrolase [Clostridiales bacterium]